MHRLVTSFAAFVLLALLSLPSASAQIMGSVNSNGTITVPIVVTHPNDPSLPTDLKRARLYYDGDPQWAIQNPPSVILDPEMFYSPERRVLYVLDNWSYTDFPATVVPDTTPFEMCSIIYEGMESTGQMGQPTVYYYIKIEGLQVKNSVFTYVPSIDPPANPTGKWTTETDWNNLIGSGGWQ